MDEQTVKVTVPHSCQWFDHRGEKFLRRGWFSFHAERHWWCAGHGDYCQDEAGVLAPSGDLLCHECVTKRNGFTRDRTASLSPSAVLSRAESLPPSL